MRPTLTFLPVVFLAMTGSTSAAPFSPEDLRVQVSLLKHFDEKASLKFSAAGAEYQHQFE
jgi:hypothetical protein